jgi:hypothetical protein
LIVEIARTPSFDPIVGKRTLYGFEMAVEDTISLAIDPMNALADFAIGHTRQQMAKRLPPHPEDFFDGVAGNAPD